MSIDRSHRRTALLLVLLVGVLYQGTLRSGFHYDDFHSIVRNPHLTLANTVSFFRDPALFSVNPESSMYRPFLLMTFSLNRAISGDLPWSYHLGNVILHAANSVVVFWLLRLLGLAVGTSVLTAVLFAVHPINSEAVSYVSSRSELLAGFGMLLFCALILRPATASRSLAATTSLALALLSKSVAIVSPILCVVGLTSLKGQWHTQRARLGLWRSIVWWAVPAAAAICVYLLTIRSLISRAVLEAPVRDFSTQLATQAKALAYYVWLTVMPVRLSVEHQFDVSRQLEMSVLLAATFLVSLAIVCVRGRGIWRWGSLWWLICLLPTVIVPLIVLVNEHRLYGASVGALAMIAGTFGSARICAARSGGRPVAVGMIAAYTIMLAFLTSQRLDAWSSERSLWQDAAQKSPESLKSQLRWADALEAGGEYEIAEEAYLRALSLRPHHPAVRNNLGRLYLLQGRLADAQHHFEELLGVSPDSVPARMNLGQIHFRQGRLDAAKEQYLAVLEFGSTNGRAQLRIAQIGLRQQASADEILNWLERSWNAGEQSVDVLVSRAITLRRLGRRHEALQAYSDAIRIDSTSSDVWFNLGNLYVELQDEKAAAAAYADAIKNAEEDGVIRHAALERLNALNARQNSLTER